MNKGPVGIIAAMRKEAEGIVANMTDVRTEVISGITFYCGELRGKSCVVAVCGIGKVFAAMCAQTMILKYLPSLIINSGVAGGLGPSLKIGDITLASSLVQHDMDTSALGDPKGMISGINMIYLPCDEANTDRLRVCAEEKGINTFVGVIASGDKFMSDASDKAKLTEDFRAIACEMEGAAIAQVCYVNEVPCCVLRAISDGGDDNAAVDYPTFAKMAAERAVNVILRFFEKL